MKVYYLLSCVALIVLSALFKTEFLKQYELFVTLIIVLLSIGCLCRIFMQYHRNQQHEHIMMRLIIKTLLQENPQVSKGCITQALEQHISHIHYAPERTKTLQQLHESKMTRDKFIRLCNQ